MPVEPATSKRVTLLGATGYTGGLIAQALQNLKISFLAAGRNPEKLVALHEKFTNCTGIFQADAGDPEQIASLLQNTDILINCVGPFNLFSHTVLQLAAESGIVYLDITGEQEFVRYSLEKIYPVAIKSGATILHSVAFESCLADLLAREIADEGINYQDISSYYHFSGARPSAGTRLTMQLSRFFPTYLFEENRLHQLEPLQKEKDVEFDLMPDYNKALFMPYPEVLFFSRKYKTTSAGSYVLLPAGEALFVGSQPVQNQKTAEEILAKHKRITFAGPGSKEREKQLFTLLVAAVPETGATKNIMLKGTDSYGLTAALIAETTLYCLQTSTLHKGVISPAALLSGSGFLEKISKQYGLEIQRDVAFRIATVKKVQHEPAD